MVGFGCSDGVSEDAIRLSQIIQDITYLEELITEGEYNAEHRLEEREYRNTLVDERDAIMKRNR
jgi:hypothetical protein